MQLRHMLSDVQEQLHEQLLLHTIRCDHLNLYHAGSSLQSLMNLHGLENGVDTWHAGSKSTGRHNNCDMRCHNDIQGQQLLVRYPYLQTEGQAGRHSNATSSTPLQVWRNMCRQWGALQMTTHRQNIPEW